MGLFSGVFRVSILSLQSPCFLMDTQGGDLM